MSSKPIKKTGSLLPVAKPVEAKREETGASESVMRELVELQQRIAALLERVAELEAPSVRVAAPDVSVAAPSVTIQSKRKWVHVHEYDARGNLVKTTSTAAD